MAAKILRDLALPVGGLCEFGSPWAGFLASELPTDGPLPNALLNDVDAGFPDRLYSVYYKTRPSAGTFLASRDGVIAFTGAPDGTYPGTMHVDKLDPGVGSVYSADGTYNLTVGAATTLVGAGFTDGTYGVNALVGAAFAGGTYGVNALAGAGFTDGTYAVAAPAATTLVGAAFADGTYAVYALVGTGFADGVFSVAALVGAGFADGSYSVAAADVISQVGAAFADGVYGVYAPVGAGFADGIYSVSNSVGVAFGDGTFDVYNTVGAAFDGGTYAVAALVGAAFDDGVYGVAALVGAAFADGTYGVFMPVGAEFIGGTFGVYNTVGSAFDGGPYAVDAPTFVVVAPHRILIGTGVNQPDLDGTFIMRAGRPTIDKDPDDVLYYGIDLSPDMIASKATLRSVVGLPQGVTQAVPAFVQDSMVVAKISGGGMDDDPDAVYSFTFRFTNSLGEIEDRTIYFRMVEK